MAMLLSYPKMSSAQTWIRQPIDGGGVAEDQQLLCHDVETDAENVLWSACMEGGVFRSEWNDVSEAWDPWTEYLPGRFMYGVEAICVEDTDYVDMEYVLAATGTMGLWYAENPATSYEN
jgi:hypothetical protein